MQQCETFFKICQILDLEIEYLIFGFKIYSFNSKSDVWWQQSQSKMAMLSAQVLQFGWADIQQLATLVDRTMHLSVTIADQSAYVATSKGECQVPWTILQE